MVDDDVDGFKQDAVVRVALVDAHRDLQENNTTRREEFEKKKMGKVPRLLFFSNTRKTTWATKSKLLVVGWPRWKASKYLNLCP